jgi:Ca-activated chloride channel homolog
MRFTSLLIVVILCVAVVSTPRAQDPAPPTPPPPPAMPRPFVTLSMIVTDKDSKGVNAIRKDQIRVFEDKDEQKVLSIDADERPVDYVLVLDSSGSLHKLFASELEAARLFILDRRPEDQIAIVRFVSSKTVEKVQEFSTDREVLLKAIDGSYLEGGQSAVIDALYLTTQYVDEYNKANEGRRKAVVVITDGEDRSSYYKQEQLMTLLRETGVQVFILGLVVGLDQQGGFIRVSPRSKAEKFLTTVAEESGGRVFFPKDKQELVAAAGEIVLDLRAQFRINYQSTHDAAKKGFRRVEVKFIAAEGDEKRKLVTPPGYFFGPRTPPAKSDKKKKS